MKNLFSFLVKMVTGPMKKHLSKSSIILFFLLSNLKGLSQKIVPVTVDNLCIRGWETSQATQTSDLGSTPTNFIRIRSGIPDPARPTAIPGNMYFTCPMDNADLEVPEKPNQEPTLARIRLRNNKYDGTLLSDLITLKYSNYTIESHGPMFVAIRLILQIRYQVTEGVWDTNSIVYDPAIEKNIAGAKYSEWREWDALNGYWTFQPQKPDRDFPEPFKLTELLAKSKYSQAAICNRALTEPNGGGGIRFTVPQPPPQLMPPDPRYRDFKGYMDAFIIQMKGESLATLYDFDNTQGTTTIKTGGCVGRPLHIEVPKVPGNTYSWEITNFKHVTSPWVGSEASIDNYIPTEGDNPLFTVTESSTTGGIACTTKTFIQIESYKGICPGPPVNWWYRALQFIGGVGVLLLIIWFVYRNVRQGNRSRT